MTHTILYVEDDVHALELMREVLIRHGYKMFAARNGAEGVKLAQQEKPDLIFMDIMMPVMNGLEATRRLKAIPETADIPVVALTAAMNNRNECLQAGVNLYLNKPTRANEVMKAVEHLLPAEEVAEDDPSGKKRVLIAEDDKDLSYIFSRTFAKWGFVVEVAMDGEEAIEKFESFKPDVLLLDVNMPKINGFGVMQHVRAQPGGADVSVVILSGNDATMLAPEASLADLMLLKPVSIRELVTLAQRLVG